MEREVYNRSRLQVVVDSRKRDHSLFIVLHSLRGKFRYQSELDEFYLQCCRWLREEFPFFESFELTIDDYQYCPESLTIRIYKCFRIQHRHRKFKVRFFA